MTTTTRLLLAAAVLAGCHHDKAPVTAAQPTADVAPNPKPGDPIKQTAVADDKPFSPGVNMSGDIAAMCGIKPIVNPSPTFDYDKDELTSDDRNILQQLATCMTTGPLKGKPVALIGRADPRGTEEYNLSLGSRRASSVGSFLTRLGVTQDQLAVTTRGALDATGTDEAGYRQDRRVDVQLKAG